MAAVMEEKTIRGLREIALLGFLVVGLFYLISLITFSYEDAGWSHSGSGMTTTNAGGLVGAWLADFSLSFFGMTAFVFPFIIFWQAYLFFSSTTLYASSYMQYVRWLGLALAIIAAASFCYLHILRCPLIELPQNSGGILGQELGDILEFSFGVFGATMLLLTLFFTGITLFTNAAWFKMVELIGKSTLMLSLFSLKKITQPWQQPIEFSSKQALAASSEAEASEAEPDQIEFIETSSPKVAVEKQDSKPSLKPVKKIKRITKEQPKKIDPVINIFKQAHEEIVEPPTAPIKANPEPMQQVVPAIAEKKQPIDLVTEATAGALPNSELLDLRNVTVQGYSTDELEDMSRLVEQSLQDFNVIVEVTAVLPGPVITRFELLPAAGVKVSRISGLAKDLARSLSVPSVRIVEVIAGKSVIGLEIPNQEREMVSFREGLESPAFVKSKAPLSIFLGKDIAGEPVVADLAKMPHLLVAGTTGSGKSVAINTMILSMLYKSTPDDVRMIMIDPKMLELSVYDGIPHLLAPVVTDMKDAANSLRWAVAEMERRYKLMSKVGVRNLAGFNKKVNEAEKSGEPIKDPMYSYETELAEGESIPTLSSLPHIVIVVDELADMMMIVGKKVEELIARLAQKARAAGIHLILATQRPSVDVLTGLIKANVPSRLSFQVSSRIDSRTVLDQGGAEFLLGNGDMLFMPTGTNIPVRAHGAFVDDHEVHHVVEFLKQTAPPNYLEAITQEHSESNDGSFVSGDAAVESDMDDLYDQAVAFVTESRKASISSVQRRFKVGYNRAASMIEAMEMAGVVSPAEGNGSRQVLAPAPIKD
ncbi:MAG: cell division protein FtsK [Methyloprofundus sp.]|nr:cell division protein FtsK [Methyloprofundus sp.]